MADVLVNALTQITSPESTDSIVMVDRNTNEGRIMDATTFARTVLEVDCGTVSSSDWPKTVTNTGITDDMVCVNAVLGTPSAMGTPWNVNTSNGSAVISGTINSDTTLILYLARRRTS